MGEGITLKEIETLSYSCCSANDFVHLNEQLKYIKSKFKSNLPHLEGLLIQPAIVSAALKTKKKYAYIRTKRRLTQCNAVLSKSLKVDQGNKGVRIIEIDLVSVQTDCER